MKRLRGASTKALRPKGLGAPKTTADAAVQARRDILETIQRIPRGRVASYSQIAFIAGWPGRARLVAKVLGDVPPEYEGLAWFRVVNAQGKIAIPPDNPGHHQQIRLLQAEGVVFLNGRVCFDKQGWQVGDASPLLD